MTFQILSQEQIAARYNVTQEQIDACERVVDCSNGDIFFQAKSSHYAENNEIYTVRYHRAFRKLSCTCKAGQNGLNCQHKRSAMAVQYEHKQAENLAYRREAERAALASQQRAYESDKAWQKEEKAASRGAVALNPQERKFEVVFDRPVPMR